MAALNWKINSLDCYPTEDGEVDVVVNAHWSLTAEDFFGGEPVTGYVYGSQGITLDADEPFIPFAQLTEAQVIAWVKKAMGEETVAAHEANVLQQIEDQKNPKVVSLPPPWVVAEPAPVV